MGGANSRRRQCDFYKWGANGVGGVRANYSVHALFGTVSGSENSVCRVFFLHSVYENGKEVK